MDHRCQFLHQLVVAAIETHRFETDLTFFVDYEFGRNDQYSIPGAPASTALAVLDLLDGLLGAPGGVATGKASASTLAAITSVATPLQAFLNDPNRDDASYPQRPKAFINYIFFGEQFKMTGGGAGPVHSTCFGSLHRSAE